MYRPGDLTPAPHLGRTGLRVVAPTHCPTGHPLRPPNVSVDYNHCGCREVGKGHLSWFCFRCGWSIWATDHVGENPSPPPAGFRPFRFVLRELEQRGLQNAPPSE